MTSNVPLVSSQLPTVVRQLNWMGSRKKLQQRNKKMLQMVLVLYSLILYKRQQSEKSLRLVLRWITFTAK